MDESVVTSWLTNWLGQIGWWIAIGVVIAAGLRTLYANPKTQKIKVMLQLVTLYARYWVWWLLSWSIWHLSVDGQVFYWWVAVLSLLYLYMNWVEPHRLRVQSRQIALPDNRQVPAQSLSPLRLAVIGDIHVGIFSTKHRLERLVNQLNRLDVDAILCVGDWLYHPGADLIGQMLIFKALNKPCYSVLSQADVEQLQAIDRQQGSGNYLLANERLTQVLATLGIQVIDDQALYLGGIRLVGLTESVKLAQPPRESGHPVIIATHDIKQLKVHSHALDRVGSHVLVIAGQTHGGQVNLPFLTPILVKAMTGNASVAGLFTHHHHNANQPKQVPSYQSWTTTGIGMTGLPFRLFCPPTIDVLTIQVTADKS